MSMYMMNHHCSYITFTIWEVGDEDLWFLGYWLQWRGTKSKPCRLQTGHLIQTVLSVRIPSLLVPPSLRGRLRICAPEDRGLGFSSLTPYGSGRTGHLSPTPLAVQRQGWAVPLPCHVEVCVNVKVCVDVEFFHCIDRRTLFLDLVTHYVHHVGQFRGGRWFPGNFSPH